MRRRPRYLHEGSKQQRQLVATALRRLEEVDIREGVKRSETLESWARCFASMAERGTRYSKRSQQLIMRGRIKPPEPPVEDLSEAVPTIQEPLSMWTRIKAEMGRYTKGAR